MLLSLRKWAILITTALLLSGCSIPSAWTPPASLPPSNAISAEDLGDFRRTDFATVERASLSPLWTERMDGELAAVLAPTGDLTAIHGRFANHGLGFQILSNSNKHVNWQHFFDQKNQTTDVFIGGNPPLVTAVAYDRAQNGNLVAFAAEGKQLWRRSVDGPISIVTSKDGSRLLIMNPVGGTLHLVNRENRLLAELAVSPDASAQFISDHNLVLVNDADRVQLLDAFGREIWSHQMERDFKRSVALSDDTRLIAMTTQGSDSSVYVFDTLGKLRWSRQLLLGGGNDALFSAASDILYVYNVGSAAGVYAFESDTGKLLWRTIFKTGTGARKASSTGLWASHNHLVWDYILTDADGNSDHWLILQDRNGQGQKRVYIGRDATVQGSADGRFLMTTHGDLGGKSTTIRLFDLSTVNP